jgi:hypothetical protein
MEKQIDNRQSGAFGASPFRALEQSVSAKDDDPTKTVNVTTSD